MIFCEQKQKLPGIRKRAKLLVADKHSVLAAISNSAQ
jgi:hypothetical protein